MMPDFRRFRWFLAPILTGFLMMAGATSTPAWASGNFGQLHRFKGPHEGSGVKKDHEFELGGQEAHAFGVNPAESDSVFVGDENGEELSGELRIQKFSSTGAFEALTTLTEKIITKNLPPAPSGFDSDPVEEFEGVAVDPELGRLYVLVVYKRFYEDAVDPNDSVAGALYAFSTKPTGTELLPATGTGISKEGLVGSATLLNPGSETQGQALLNPAGITVNPKTHEVLILGDDDKGAGGQHVAIDRVSDEGTLLGTYLDPNEAFPTQLPDSPVVSPKGRVYFEAGDEIQELPSVESAAAPTTIFDFNSTLTPFSEELLAFGVGGTSSGGALAIVPDAEPHASEGRLIVDAEINTAESDGVLIGGEENPGAMILNYSEEHAVTTASEIGWTGGVEGAGEEGELPKACQIGFAVEYPLVAAGTGEQLFVLSPSFAEVIDFGPTGEGCPTAHVAPTGLEAKVFGSKTTSVSTSSKVTLLANVVQANVLSVTWNFGDGTEAKVETLPGEAPGEYIQRQAAEVEHKFVKTGKLKVKAVIDTDDLAVLPLTAETEITVTEATEPITITKEPAGQSVVEGATATFEAGATGAPKPTVRWEVKVPKGSTWGEVAGATTDKLEVSGTTTAENGNEYRAVFKSGSEEKETKGAALIVESKAAHEQKEKEQKEKEQKAKEAAERAQEEANRAAAERAAAEQAAQAKAAQEAKEAEEKAKGGVKGFVEGSPLAKIAGTSLSVSSSGALTIKVTCPANTSCSGTVTLRTLTAVSARLASAAKSKKKSILTLATGSFTVAGGQSKTITLHLSAAGRALLSRSHVLQARATVLAHDLSGGSNTDTQTVTLRLAKPKSHH